MTKILDACCGSKMFWFDKNNPEVEFCDIRKVDNEVIWRSKDGKSERAITVNPTTVADFRKLPFEDEAFYHVVFDPPHLLKVGDNAWMAKKYGKLSENWKDDIKKGFSECMRVLKPYGTLIFKWSEVDIKISEILEIIGYEPLYGHRSGKHMTTHWMAFVKGVSQQI